MEAFHFTSEGLDEDEAFARYQSLYGLGSDVSRGEGPFRAEVRAWRLDHAILYDRRLTGVIHERSHRVASDQFSHFVVTMVLEGQMASQVDPQTSETVMPGEIQLIDTQRPVRTEPRDARLITASLSRHLVEGALANVAAAHGEILRPPEALMLADYMKALATRAPDLTAEATPALSRAFMNILSAAAMSQPATPALETRRQDMARMDAVERHVQAHLGDRALSAETLSAATGVSRSSLYRLLEGHGGVSHYIQRRRLDTLRALLDAGDATPLSELAGRLGFANESHMSRQFRALYGAAPGAYRQQALNAAARDGADLARRRWAGWMLGLR